jgi:hypothetical protein
VTSPVPTIPTPQDYLEAARANVTALFTSPADAMPPEVFERTVANYAAMPSHIAAVDSAFAAGQRACPKCTEDARSAAEWAAEKAAMSPEQLHARCMHPGYEYATTEGQRKAWPYVDEPPEGEGWVRNVHRGRDGWERFDYTEESYWMRPEVPDA